MTTALVSIFALAYAAIALEHPLKVNKSASALLAAGLLWTIYALAGGDFHVAVHNLQESVGATAQIVFFLMGAMTIVEVVDAHNGFYVITSRIKTTSLSSLLWLVGFVSFFLSSILDNLTTTIVMISLMKKLLERHEDRLFFAGIIVIAANAGGAWTPIGDVTTTMLWIGGQITTLNIIKGVFLPSLACLIVPLLITSWTLRGREVVAACPIERRAGYETTPFEQNFMFCMGIGTLISVPIFKAVTHLPPFMGILFGLGFQLVAGLPYGMLLGLLLGLMNIVPYLGNIVGMPVIGALALFGDGGGGGKLGTVALIFLVVQSLDAYFITPRIIGNRTGLNAFVVIFSLFFWSSVIGGALGMVLAIPLSAFIAVFWQLLVREYLAPAAGRESEDETGGVGGE